MSAHLTIGNRVRVTLRNRMHSYRAGDKGIVLWGPSRFAWDETNGWWAATLAFIRQIASAKPLGSAS